MAVAAKLMTRLRVDKLDKNKPLADGSDGQLVEVGNRNGRTGSNVRPLSAEEVKRWKLGQ
jgi:hypothetical protein